MEQTTLEIDIGGTILCESRVPKIATGTAEAGSSGVVEAINAIFAARSEV